jgi:hypothetical protein
MIEKQKPAIVVLSAQALTIANNGIEASAFLNPY